MHGRVIPERFKAALSFAGAERHRVREVAVELERRLGVGKVFFDEWFEAYVAGTDADLKLQDIFLKRSELVIVCVSGSYNDKPWTRLEHQAIRALTMSLERQSFRVLPLRFGDGEVDGILVNAIVPDVRDRAPERICDLILERIQHLAGSIHPVSPYHSDGNALKIEKPTPPTRDAREGPRAFDLQRLKDLRDYAYSASGLNLDNKAAIGWAETKLALVPQFDLAKFKDMKAYAYAATGLDLNNEDAAQWAEAKLRLIPPFDFAKFKDLNAYAYAAIGLNLNKKAAVEWAEAKIALACLFDFEQFKALKAYAYSASGLNLSNKAAARWAETKIALVPPFDFENFKALKAYACSASGLNLDNAAAAQWAEEKLGHRSS